MGQPYGVARRVGLAVFTITGKHLIEEIKGDRATAVAFADSANCVEASVKAMRMLADDLERAVWCIQVALCVRPDMDAVVAEADQEEGSVPAKH